MVYIEKEEQFNDLINNELVIVDFYADWCGPCQLISPVLEELEKEESKLTVVKVDVEKYEKLARKHNINSIPALEIYKKSVMVNKTVGYKTKEELKGLLK